MTRCRSCDIKTTYHAIIRTALASEELRLFTVAFVDYAIWEHRLLRNSEDEGAEASVLVWLAFVPHFSSESVTRLKRVHYVRHTIHDLIDFT